MCTGSTAGCAGSRSEAGAFTFEAVIALAIASGVVVFAQFVEAQAAGRLARARTEWAEFMRVTTLLACLPRFDDRAVSAQGGPLAHPACSAVAGQIRIEAPDGLIQRKSLQIDGRPHSHLSLRFAP